ncbi:MAG TPA: adenylate/guanylate cyclase domain-containing protein [Methylomirabilota bacterium]
MASFDPAEETQRNTTLPLGATVTIFFSDIRGFTDYTDQHGDDAAFRVLQQHNRLVRRQIDLFAGQVVKTQGDSFMVAFRTARAAIQCAVAIQRALSAATPGEAGKRIALGIGVNTGEPIQEGGDFFGGPVNLASRICSAAGPGQVLISETTRYVAGRIESVEFIDRGLHDLKGFQEPQRLYEVRWTMAETPDGAGPDLQWELNALTERCSQLGAELLDISRAMQGVGSLPPETLGRQIVALRGAFTELRARVSQRAGPAGVAVPATAEGQASLGELEPLVVAVAQAEVGRTTAVRTPRTAPEDDKARVAALEAAVQRAIGVLNRVLGIHHQDDAAFQPLLECQAKASELRLKLSRVVSTSRDYPADRVDEAMLPFADLLTLVLGRENLDDERWMRLEENVGRGFGRQLVIAATRGRLVMAGADLQARSAPRAPAPREPLVATEAPRQAEVSRPVVEAPPPPPRREAPEPPPPLARPAEEAAPAIPQVDPRAAAVLWWAGAHSAWSAWKSSGMATAHALRAALARHPYLLSVPIRKAPSYDNGRLAADYFLLLDHVENVSPAFIRTAIDKAVQQAGGAGDPGALDRALYDLLVTKGRLRQTYPDFLRDVMVAAIPNPGLWTDAVITENEETTVVTTRVSEGIGQTPEQSRELSDPKDRLAEHRFTMRIGPLTSRFICLKRGDLKESRDVDVQLTENGTPSDAAIVVMLRSDHTLYATPKRQGKSSTTYDGLGRNFSALWFAVFNSDPEAEKPFDLVFNMRAPAPPATARRSAFGGRPR